MSQISEYLPEHHGVSECVLFLMLIRSKHTPSASISSLYETFPVLVFNLPVASLNKRHQCFGQWTFVITLCWPFCPERLLRVRRVAMLWKHVRKRPENEAVWNNSSACHLSFFHPWECGREGRKEGKETGTSFHHFQRTSHKYCSLIVNGRERKV